MTTMADLFSRRFREGFVEGQSDSILKLPLSKLCAVPFALQSTFIEGVKRAKRRREGEEG